MAPGPRDPGRRRRRLCWHKREPAAPAKPAARAPAAVPVTLARVRAGSARRGAVRPRTVQAYNTVQRCAAGSTGEILKNRFREGQVVKKGEPPRPGRSAALPGRPRPGQGEEAQDEANVKNAKADLERYTKLGDYASRQQTETQGATVNQLTAQIAGDQAAIDNRDATLLRDDPGADRRRHRLPADRCRQHRQRRATDRDRHHHPGRADLRGLYRARGAARRGDAGARRRPGPGRGLEHRRHDPAVRGRLDLVNNQVDTATGTIRLKASFANKDHALWPGVSVSTKMRHRHDPRRRHGAGRRGAARAEGPLRLRGRRPEPRPHAADRRRAAPPTAAPR